MGRVTRGHIALLGPLWLACATSGLALAHHPGQLTDSLFPRQGVSASAEVQQASFDITGRRGTWTRLALQSQYSPLSWLRFGGTVPMVWVREHGHEDAVGMGDVEVELAVPLSLTADKDLSLEIGLGLEVPTGDVDKGLGGGHYALIPQLKSVWRAGTVLAVMTDLQYAAVLEGHAHSTQSWHSPLAIHALHELTLRTRAVIIESTHFWGLGLGTVYGVAEPVGAGPTTVQVDAGATMGAGWTLTAQFEIPFAGTKRYDWRMGIGVRWVIVTTSDEDRGSAASKAPSWSPESS